MPPLRRHQLAWLSESGWQRMLARDWPDEVRLALLHWQAHQMPWVVTRQPAPRTSPDSPVHLGLPTPPQWGRHLASAWFAPEGIRWFSEFPQLNEAITALPRGGRNVLRRLDRTLKSQGLQARVYGSLGWQCVTGLPYLHEHSDLDLWLAVTDARQADEAARVLQACHATMRIDGELMFPDGRAVAWREWQGWRAGRQQRVLVKGLDTVTLEAAPTGEEQRWAQAA